MDRAEYENIMYDKDGMLVSKEQFHRMSNHQKHIILWNWLSRNPNRKKQHFFLEYESYFWSSKEMKNEIPPSFCYACEEADMHDAGCDSCPITWVSSGVTGLEADCFCTSDDSLFTKWHSEFNEYYSRRFDSMITPALLVKRRQLAEQIRDLPWVIST